MRVVERALEPLGLVCAVRSLHVDDPWAPAFGGLAHPPHRQRIPVQQEPEPRQHSKQDAPQAQQLEVDPLGQLDDVHGLVERQAVVQCQALVVHMHCDLELTDLQEGVRLEGVLHAGLLPRLYLHIHPLSGEVLHPQVPLSGGVQRADERGHIVRLLTTVAKAHNHIHRLPQGELEARVIGEPSMHIHSGRRGRWVPQHVRLRGRAAGCVLGCGSCTKSCYQQQAARHTCT
mmetsp:Transcript_19686/g.59507  ORF Transcript_19686/g.59507 Transcript_19686/m.59507 type:complete len:231 (-) Transcript_19686:102-794(-)